MPHVYRAVRGGWSCALVSLPGGGLSNVLRYLADPKAGGPQPGPAVPPTLVTYLECDSLANPRALYAALLAQVAAAARIADWPRAEQAALRRLGEAADPAAGLEAVLNYICSDRERHVVVCLDEFDTPLQHAPAAALRHLRGLRDDHKYRLAYVLGLHQEPETLLAARPAAPEPGARADKFTELVAEHTFAVRPYTRDDTVGLILRKTAGWQEVPTAEQRDFLYRASGGHARLLVAALVYLGDRLHLPAESVKRGLRDDPGVAVACGSLWAALSAGEQRALWLLAHEHRDDLAPGALDRLLLRGLAIGGPAFVFADLFETFVLDQAQPVAAPPRYGPAAASRLRDPDIKPYW